MLYMIAAGMIPILLIAANIFSKLNSIDEVKNNILYVEKQALQRENKQSLNMIVRENFRHADHFYIAKYLETQTFLEPEIENLQKLVNNKYYAGDENVKKRLEYIAGPSNNLLFSEANVQAYPFFQETTDTL